MTGSDEWLCKKRTARQFRNSELKNSAIFYSKHEIICSWCKESPSAMQDYVVHSSEAFSHFSEFPAAETIQLSGQGGKNDQDLEVWEYLTRHVGT